MAKFTKKFLPLEDAVKEAAEQNFQVDLRNELTEGTWETLDAAEKETYLDEARHLMQTTGENYFPVLEGHQHICLQQ